MEIPGLLWSFWDRQTGFEFEMFATGEALRSNLPRPGPLTGDEQGAKAGEDYGSPPNPKPLSQVV
jgi:hypothetical protein